MAEKNTLGRIAREVVRSLRPLVLSAGADPNELPAVLVVLLDGTGVFLDRTLPAGTIQTLNHILREFSDVYARVAPLVEREELPEPDEIDDLISDLVDLVESLLELSDLDLKAFDGDGALVALEDLGLLLVEYLVADYLLTYYPRIFHLLVAIGGAQLGDIEAPKVEDRFLRLKLRQVGAFVQDPRKVLKDLYKWGSADFKAYELLAPLGMLLRGFGLPASVALPEAALDAALGWDARAEQLDVLLRLPFFTEGFGNATTEAGVALLPLRQPGPGVDALALIPYGVGTAKQSFDFGNNWVFEYVLSGGLTVQYGLVMTPDRVELRELTPGGNRIGAAAQAGATLLRRLAGGQRMTLFAQGDIALVEIGSIGARAFFAADTGGDAEVGFETEVKDGQIVIRKGKGDGFLQKILPEDGIISPFAVTAGLSNTRGLYFRGAAGLAVTLAIHKDLFGVLKIETIDLAVLAKGDDTAGFKIELLAAASAALDIGPFHASVEKIGLRGDVTFPESGGNLGVADLALRFKPPDGAGMSIKAKAVAGGGYLFFDPDNGQYAGILNLAVQDKFSITVIGLLTTKLPDGRQGFSLLLIITAEFPPIQLGYGFVLMGVGGLIGVHRTMVVDALRAGVKGGGLNAILFPKNPIENAQKIISDLKSFFPPAENRFAFGPMAKIAWGGAYPLLTIDLGILIELPAPVRVALLGRITLALPKREKPEDKAIVFIQMDILGVLDFEKSDLSIDATLFDSSIATFPLTGDMALRFNWGAKPDFATSAGGFHPAYNPPPGFPSLRRLALSIASGENPRIRAESYLAVTTAAAMTGAGVELYAERDFGGVIGKFSVQAHLGFDALVRFVPFSFVVEMGADASLRRNNQILFAVTLRLTLSGPQPWDAHGYARFEFLGKHEIPFAVTIGEDPAPAALAISRPIDDLVAELGKASNWTAQLPGGGQAVASLREMERDPKVILAHPLGRLAFRQQVTPLKTPISKYGETQVAGPQSFDLEVALGGTDAPLPTLLKDNFAPGMFHEMSDDAKLGEPAFVALPSGYEGIGLAKNVAAVGNSTSRTFEYDEVVIDDLEARDFTPMARFQLSEAIVNRATATGAAAVADLRTTGAAAFAGPAGQRVVLLEPAYVVADSDTLDAGGVQGVSHYEAKLERQREGKNASRRQVVGAYEAR